MMPPHKSDEPPPKDGPARGGVVRFEISPSTMITMVLVVAGVWVLIRLLPVVLVLVTALIIVGALSPVVQWLEARRLRRGLNIARSTIERPMRTIKGIRQAMEEIFMRGICLRHHPEQRAWMT